MNHFDNRAGLYTIAALTSVAMTYLMMGLIRLMIFVLIDLPARAIRRRAARADALAGPAKEAGR